MRSDAAYTTVMKTAAKQAPATIKQRRPRKASFQVFTVSQLLERRRDPRDILLELASMATEALMEKAGCTYLEAVAERRLCAQAVLPYVSQKLPVQVDMRHTRAIHLHMLDKDEYSAIESIALAADAELLEQPIDAQIIDAKGMIEGPNTVRVPNPTEPSQPGDAADATTTEPASKGDASSDPQ